MKNHRPLLAGDYSEKGPCCDVLDGDRARFRAEVQVLNQLVDGNPRYVVQLGRIMSERLGSYMRLLTDRAPCPCNEAPDPVQVRRLSDILIARKSDGHPDPLGTALDKIKESLSALLTDDRR